jgi:hypothetical protein
MINLVNKLKWTLEAIEACVVTEYADKTGKGMRCHEIARITINVLQALDYDCLKVVDGVILVGNEAMTHSWIEGSIDPLSPCMIIETKPYDNKINSNIGNHARGEEMVIPMWDAKGNSYIRLEHDAFLKRLEDEKTEIDFNLFPPSFLLTLSN